MSPTIFRQGGYRFYFFSKGETRMHVHVICADGEAKFWLESEIALARSFRLSQAQLREVQRLIEEHCDEFKAAWRKHFPG